MPKKRERIAEEIFSMPDAAAALIPGLPDDIAVDCLARVPHESYNSLRSVCRRWRRLVVDSGFLRYREGIGFAQDLVFLVQALLDGEDDAAAGGGKDVSSPPAYGIGVYNATDGTWRRASTPAPVPVFAQCAAAGRKLVVVGGWEPSTLQPVSTTMILDLATGLWREGAPMPGPPRSLFGCGAVGDDKVIVAGGHDAQKNALKSALMYDVSADEWSPLPDMNNERDEPTVAGCYVISGYCTERQGAFERSMEWYDAGEGRWRAEEASWPEGAAAAAVTTAAAVNGRLWRVEGGEGKRVREWEGPERGWKDVSPGPEKVAGGARAVTVGKGQNLIVAGGEEGRTALWAMDAAARRWKKVEPPAGFGGFAYAIAAVSI